MADPLIEARDWWRDEADRRGRECEWTFLFMGVIAIVGTVGAFWLGVLIG